MINIFGKTQSEDDSLAAFAEVDIGSVFWNAKVSEDFKTKTHRASQYLKVTSKVKARGGKLIPNSSTDPIDLQKEYT